MTTLTDLSSSPESLRYPIGKFSFPAEYTAALRAASIATLRAFPGQLTGAVEGWSDVQLDTPYRPGGWTVRQLIHHMADSHMVAYCRLRLALTEDWPTVTDYDEQAWAQLGDASAAPPGLSLELLAGVHGRWVLLLESLAEPDWSRGYTHSVMGDQTVEKTVTLYAWHSRHHLAHVTGMRQREGW